MRVAVIALGITICQAESAMSWTAMKFIAEKYMALILTN